MSLCVCPICGELRNNLTSHITKTHKMNKDEFLNKYPGTKMLSEETSKRISDKLVEHWKDPDYAERCSKYWRSKEHGRRVSERLRKVWKEDPNKYGIPFKEFAQSDKVREIRSNNMRKVSKRLWQDPEYIERRRQSGRIQMEKNLQDPTFGYPNRKNCYYKGIYYRSSWEIMLVKYLEEHNINYLYESHRFEYEIDDITHIYIPDFYFKDYNLFIEVKPEKKIDSLTDIKLESVRAKGYRAEYLTDCTEQGILSQLVPLLSNG